MDFDRWLVFLAIWTAASLPLGPNALNCISAAAADGFRRSLWTIVGIVVAALCHMTATVLGVATILLANAALFQVLKVAGAAYLIWMGLSLWRKTDAEVPVAGREPTDPLRMVRRAFLISMSNPKAILAYLAVFSQFLGADTPLSGQLAILVPTALAVAVLVYVGYCALGVGAGRLLRTARRRRVFNRGVGSVYVLAGFGLLATGSSDAGR